MTTPAKPNYAVAGTSDVDNLIIQAPTVTGSVSIPSGTISRGAVVTAAGAVAGASDAYGVLLEDVDATGGPTGAVVGLDGVYNSLAMSLGGADAAYLRGIGIYIEDAVIEG